MAGDYSAYSESFIAAADLRLLKDRFVTLTAANTVNICGAGGKILGVLKNAPNIGHAARVQILGMAEVLVDGSGGGDILIGSWLKSAANGIGAVTTTDKDVVGGMANAPTTAQNVLIEVVLTGPFTLSAA